jgi:agmatine deiminase
MIALMQDRRPNLRIPSDWEPHQCCWMAWSVHCDEWDKASVNKIKRNLSEVAQTIARYEPVRILAPRGPTLREARREFAGCTNILVIDAPVDDFWMRDIMPTFALTEIGSIREVVGIDWNFNGWGATPDRAARAGDRLAKIGGGMFGVSILTASFVAEGGALLADGRGTMITSRSCLLNPNRNPDRRDTDVTKMIEADLARFGIQQVIWLDGDPDEPITSGHVDGYVLCAPGGVILVEANDREQDVRPLGCERDIAVLENATDIGGDRFKVTHILPPRPRYLRSNQTLFAACYLNAYLANGAVIGARFGDKERDELAQSVFENAFPGREVVMLRIDAIAAGGGGIRCLTQPMPAKRANVREASL